MLDNAKELCYNMPYITVASQYSIYKLEEEMIELLGTGMKQVPPQIALEVMVLNGQAQRVGTVGTMTMDMTDAESFFVDGEDDGEDPPEGAGPWLEGED